MYAGFIYGTDADTLKTADLIIDFVKGNSIHSSMIGKLTPMPHTPLYTDLKERGRLVEGGEASNNIDEKLQYQPVMGEQHLHEGFSHILSSLFNRQALYERAQSVLKRVDVHIFRQGSVRRREAYAALRFFFSESLKSRGESLRLIEHAFQRDRILLRRSRDEARALSKFWEDITASAGAYIELDTNSVKQFTQMVDYAHEALVRYGVDRGLAEVRDFVQGARESISKGSIALEHGQSVYDEAMEYVEARSKMLQFPGVSVVRAFELSIMGSHYRTVVGNVLAHVD